jgi:hypothetical protein
MKGRRSQQPGLPGAGLPLAGLVLVLVATTGALVIGGPAFALMVLIPPAPAIFGGWLRIRPFQLTGVVLLGLASVLLLLFAATAREQPGNRSFMFNGLGNSFARPAMMGSVYTTVCAWLLSPEWGHRAVRPSR